MSPWTTSTWSNGMPSSLSTICDQDVSWPWPWAEEPVITVTEPVGCMRTMRRLPAAGADADRLGHGRRREAADLDPGREPDAAVVAARRGLGAARLEAGVVGHLERLVERLAVVAGVVDQPGGRGVRELGGEVAPPQLGRIDAELVGEARR